MKSDTVFYVPADQAPEQRVAMQCIPTDQSKSKASTYTRGMDAGNYTLCASQIASETAARLRLPANAKSRGVVACTAEVSIRGQWVHVPALQVQGPHSHRRRQVHQDCTDP